MSCQFTCNGCGESVEPIYAFGRWQHPQGWFTRASEVNGKQTGLTACSEECIKRVEDKGVTKSGGKTGRKAA